MSIQVETRDIDGHTYEMFQMSATKSIKVLTRIMKLIGEPIGLLSGGVETKKSVLDLELNSDILGRALKAIAEKLDEDMILTTIKEILEPVQCDGKRILFETHFQGRIGHMFKVVKAALEVNYKDFFDAASGLAGYVGSIATMTSDSQTSTGASGVQF